MKYYLLNKQEIKDNININPIMIKTKSFVKLKKLKSLQKQVGKLFEQIKKELWDTNNFSTGTYIDKFLDMELEDLTEITSQEYSKLKTLFLLDTQEQRISICNKTTVLKGKLYGNQIK